MAFAETAVLPGKPCRDEVPVFEYHNRVSCEQRHVPGENTSEAHECGLYEFSGRTGDRIGRVRSLLASQSALNHIAQARKDIRVMREERNRLLSNRVGVTLDIFRQALAQLGPDQEGTAWIVVDLSRHVVFAVHNRLC